MKTTFKQFLESNAGWQVLRGKAAEKIAGTTSNIGYLHNWTFDQIVEKLGPPSVTYDNDDEKVFAVWVIKGKDCAVTIYDYKSSSRYDGSEEELDLHDLHADPKQLAPKKEKTLAQKLGLSRVTEWSIGAPFMGRGRSAGIDLVKLALGASDDDAFSGDEYMDRMMKKMRQG